LTSSLLGEAGSSVPPIESVLDTFMRELAGLTTEPAALIVDDFHVVDDSADVRLVMRALIERSPERLSFILASRRTPPLRFARLRALGEFAELGTEELRFDPGETKRLFTDTYAMAMESNLLDELFQRTEGWAASLQLVRTALLDRDAAGVRAFIRSLSGTEGHLYEYLAEEVVGDLPEGLQDFLMRTSVLDTFDARLGSVAAESSPKKTEAMIEKGEQLGLLGRQSQHSGHLVRAHPLVRDFLQARLRRSFPPVAVEAIHLRVARVAEALDWRLASYHYLAAGAIDDAGRVLSDSLEVVLATGAYASAESVAVQLPDLGPSALREIILSRVALKAGDSEAAESHARVAVALEPTSDVAAWNAMMVALSCGSFEDLESYAAEFRNLRSTPFRQLSADAVIATVAASVDGALGTAEELMVRAGVAAAQAGHAHFHGVSLLNAAQLRRARGDARTALGFAESAIDELEATSSGIELVSARLARAWALAHLGRLEEARAEIARADSEAVRRLEFAFEAADIEALYGSAERAERLLAPFDSTLHTQNAVGDQALLTRVSIDIAQGRLEQALDRLGKIAWGRRSTGPGTEGRRRAVQAYLAYLSGDPNAADLIDDGISFATRQGANLWVDYLAALRSLAAGEEAGDRQTAQPVFFSMVAEAAATHLPLEGEFVATLQVEAASRPERWRPALRRTVDTIEGAPALSAGALLNEIGELQDVLRLRALARRTGSVAAPALGRSLARRLAPRAHVQDLGHVEILIGSRRIQGTEIRRKVLALLCFLLTKKDFKAQREEVLDALWPDLEPGSALNSLNQTAYFLRRVFEPDYSEDLSPGYVGQSTEFIWLDPDLTEASSVRCAQLIRDAGRAADPVATLAAVRSYKGPFAMDFIYEDWAAPYREGLHAAYLHFVETSLRVDIDTGQFSRGIEVAQAVAQVEPDAEQIQVALVKLYRLSGAHAAASEQYGRYATILRDLGVDPPPFEDV
jgi:ATP/maltotriose-dependent transcriptional regulator MalT